MAFFIIYVGTYDQGMPRPILRERKGCLGAVLCYCHLRAQSVVLTITGSVLRGHGKSKLVSQRASHALSHPLLLSHPPVAGINPFVVDLLAITFPLHRFVICNPAEVCKHCLAIATVVITPSTNYHTP